MSTTGESPAAAAPERGSDRAPETVAESVGRVVLDDLREQLGAARAEIEKWHGDAAKATAHLEKLTADRDALQRRVAELEGKIKAYRQAQADLLMEGRADGRGAENDAVEVRL